METPEKVYAGGGLKSHRVMGLEDELTPTPGSTPNSKFRGSASPSPDRKTDPTQETQAGGVTGFIKSLVSGTPVDEPAKNGDVTHAGDLKDGTSGAVKTTSGTGSAPDSLLQSSQPVGVAKTELKETQSPYAPALESIAGPGETADLSGKYGPALEPIANTSSYSTTGVVGAVSAAAGSAVETIKQAAGYGPTTEDGKGTDGGSADALAPGPALVKPADLPKYGEVHATDDGTVEIRDAVGTANGTGTGSSTTATAVPTSVSPAESQGGPSSSVPRAEAPASALDAGKGTQGAPKPAAGATAGATTGATPVQTAGTPAAAERKAPVSAFASSSQTDGKGTSKPAEIKEELPTTAPKTGAKPTTGDADKAGAKPAAEGEKAKGPKCGCCVIS